MLQLITWTIESVKSNLEIALTYLKHISAHTIKIKRYVTL